MGIAVAGESVTTERESGSAMVPPETVDSMTPLEIRQVSKAMFTRLQALEEGTADYQYVRNTLIEPWPSSSRRRSARPSGTEETDAGHRQLTSDVPAPGPGRPFPGARPGAGQRRTGSSGAPGRVRRRHPGRQRVRTGARDVHVVRQPLTSGVPPLAPVRDGEDPGVRAVVEHVPVGADGRRAPGPSRASEDVRGAVPAPAGGEAGAGRGMVVAEPGEAGHHQSGGNSDEASDSCSVHGPESRKTVGRDRARRTPRRGRPHTE